MEFRDYLLSKDLATSTVTSYQKIATQFASWLATQNIEIEQVSYNDVLHYIQLQTKGLSQRTVSNIVVAIKHHFTFLLQTKQILENPAVHIQIKGIKKKVLYHIITKQELESLYSNFSHTNHTEKRNKVIVGLMVYQGLKLGELASLTVQNVNLREGSIFINGTRKSNQREMKLESLQIMDMMEYTLQVRQAILQLRKTNIDTDLLFVAKGEKQEFRCILEAIMKKLKSRHSFVTNPKQIRTSVITHWLKLHNLRRVQNMAGHRYISSTESYLINDLDDLTEEVNKFHPI